MLIPLHTDRQTKRRPILTETLIVANLVVYLAGLMVDYFGTMSIDQFISRGWYMRDVSPWWTAFTYQFLHNPADVFHLGFNMLFLWIFGGAVEDRLGRVGFLAFYLIGGVVAGLAHAQISPAPVIGASGAIAAVTGAFLALFPRSTIKVLLFFVIIGVYHIPALWFIGFYFVVDVLRQTGQILGGSSGGVAYMAHIAGYVYGFFLAFALLGLRVIKHDDYDIFFLFRQSRRRAAFRAANRSGRGAVWDGPPSVAGEQLARNASASKPELTTAQKEQAAARTEISHLVTAHELSDAAAKYRDLLRHDPRATFPEDRQLDLANQMYAEGHHDEAARAYELFLEAFPGSPRASEVRLILGLLYTRRLGRPDRAKDLLRAAKVRLLDPQQSRLADELLGELPS